MATLGLWLAIIASMTFGCSGQWIWANHGTPPVYTSLAPMKSGSTTKLFGVSNGNLWERYWAGTSWVWHNHGPPYGLWSGERLAAEPCVMRDGRVYIVTNKGRLCERYYGSGSWHWGWHGAPSGKTLRPLCTATTGTHYSRVFVVSTDFRLYEHYWSYSASAWVWRDHGKPPLTGISPAKLDSCTFTGCSSTETYVVGTNGKLYYRYITPANVGVPSWSNQGGPSGKAVHSVRVSAAGLFVTTRDNFVCERFTSISWKCSQPPGSASSPKQSVIITKAMHVNSCNKLPGDHRWLFAVTWDSSTSSRARLWALKITGSTATSSHQWTFQGSVGSLYYQEPDMFMSWNCPKVFVVRSNGNVYERYVS